MRRGRNRVHECYARGCSDTCPTRHLMCITHWRLVPGDLQRNVYKHVSAVGTRRYRCAADAAMLAVAIAENTMSHEGAARFWRARYGAPTLRMANLFTPFPDRPRFTPGVVARTSVPEPEFPTWWSGRLEVKTWDGGRGEFCYVDLSSCGNYRECRARLFANFCPCTRLKKEAENAKRAQRNAIEDF